MHHGGRMLFLSCVSLASCGFATFVPNVSLTEDGKLLSVSFVHGNKSCNYGLVGISTFARNATIIVHTEQGAERQLPPASRTFVSREPGMWATAILDGSDGSQMQVSGLFVCEDLLIDIPSNDTTLRPQPTFSNIIQSSGSERARRMRGGRHLAGTTVSEGVYKIANETDDWKVPAELGAYVAASSYAWQGEKWYPGCYSNDNQLHVFKVGLVADVAAVHKHGSRLNDLIENTIAKASFIYESQFNIRLEIGDLQIYTSANTAPDYATDECPGIYTQLDRLTAGANSAGGAVHLLTGCGEGYGIVGLAYVGSICANRHKTGVDQLHNSMSWLTFAHELGHNFGGEHSFEEGQGSTGGIMDYGDGRLNGEYQFNTKYRKAEMCRTMNDRLSQCDGSFLPATQGRTPSPTPPSTTLPSPTPMPPSAGSCYSLEACRAAAQRLNLKVNGLAFYSFAGKYSETGCFAYSSGPWKGYAWYGVRDDGSEVQSESDLTTVASDRFRLDGTYGCSTSSSPGCEDVDVNCDVYASQQLCDGEYSHWMAANCKKSCRLCSSSGCTDDYSECAIWNSYGYCDGGDYMSWMHQFCKQSCNSCALRASYHELKAPDGAPKAPSTEHSLLSCSTSTVPGLLLVAVLVAWHAMSRQEF